MALISAKAGHKVRAWNRSGKPSTAGSEMVAAPASAFKAEVVFTKLSDSAIREVVLKGRAAQRAARSGLGRDLNDLFSFAGELAAKHAAAGMRYVSAPMVGGPDVAAKGELNILAAGKRGRSRSFARYSRV